MVKSLEQKVDETQKKYEETSNLSEVRLKQAQEAESKIIELQTAVKRCLTDLYMYANKHICLYTCMQRSYNDVIGDDWNGSLVVMQTQTTHSSNLDSLMGHHVD